MTKRCLRWLCRAIPEAIIVAEQLIAALNYEQNLLLPGQFAMMETANNAGAAMQLRGYEDRIMRLRKESGRRYYIGKRGYKQGSVTGSVCNCSQVGIFELKIPVRYSSGSRFSPIWNA